MATPKTVPTDADPLAFLRERASGPRLDDCLTLLDLMQSITGAPPVLWGDSIVGFGTYHYRYASGREGDWMLTGFSPRKQNLTIYVMSGFDPFEAELAQLGKHKHSVSCLYVKQLADLDLVVLRDMLTRSVEIMRERYD